jgi:hypothetical protein
MKYIRKFEAEYRSEYDALKNVKYKIGDYVRSKYDLEGYKANYLDYEAPENPDVIYQIKYIKVQEIDFNKFVKKYRILYFINSINGEESFDVSRWSLEDDLILLPEWESSSIIYNL